jgi:acylphosphatase
MSTASGLQAVRGRVDGRVQGVAFRASMHRQALRAGVAGWVRNRPDGTVEFLIQGVPDAVRQMLDWAQRGPPGASVDAMNVHETDPEPDLHAFEIRF